MRDYQRIKGTKYILPRQVYHITLWKVRDYYRLKRLADDILEERTFSYDGLPKDGGISDKVASKVIKREKYLTEIDIIDKTLLEIPAEYRSGIWDNIQFGKPYPMDADRTTYSRYKTKFIYKLAGRFSLI
ncbi:hypothetical protein [Criibacterium bergeronii]|uniref:Uncharacterized protein n=1 Tax=Criibacterium bergeronii TaxID=1871336 RepID=A0A371IJQ2_9FIRM|nr:hypothetical protein [Criibacterium bergeronii]RDY20722.1 hypothetical protein BBG48_008540 [Criibacterium bergeronii]